MRSMLRQFDLRWPLLALCAAALLGPKVAPEVTIDELATQLTSKDEAKVREALATIRARIETDPTDANYVRSYWLKPLLDAKRWADAEDLCVRAMIATPTYAQHLEYLQRQRVLMLRAQNRNDDAVREARTLFSVSSMEGTESALLLLAECLNAASGNDPTKIDPLIAEQVAGLAGTMEHPVRSPTLLGIASNPASAAAWEAAAKTFRTPTGELPASIPDLLALGNLELLACRPDEAKEAFAKVRTLADVAYFRASNEAQARLLKAEDGTVGRANAYAASLRSK